jgi:photosystem II stability/assembly factor-like uncharacterized protein
MAQVEFFAVNPADSALAYIGLPGPGFERSTDGGRTWAPAPNQPPGIFGVAFDPHNPATLYALPTLQRSTDNGTTWSRLGTTGSSGTNVLLFPAPRILLAGGCGIWRSTNGGRTFTNTLACGIPGSDATRSVIRLASGPRQPLTVYAGVFIFEGAHNAPQIELWRSDDGGSQWRLLSHDGYLFALDPVLSRTVYLAVGSVVWRSTNGGTTWRQGGNLGAVINDLITDPASPATLLAATTAGVRRSTDGGATWTPVDAGLIRQGRTWINRLVAHPTDPHHFYALAAVGGLFEATFPAT